MSQFCLPNLNDNKLKERMEWDNISIRGRWRCFSLLETKLLDEQNYFHFSRFHMKNFYETMLHSTRRFAEYGLYFHDFGLQEFSSLYVQASQTVGKLYLYLIKIVLYLTLTLIVSDGLPKLPYSIPTQGGHVSQNQIVICKPAAQTVLSVYQWQQIPFTSESVRVRFRWSIPFISIQR